MQVTEYVGNYANIVNANAARIYGVEGQIGLDLTEDLRLDVGAAYTHGQYLKFTNAERYLFSPIFGVTVVPGSNASGNTTERTPEFTGDLTLTYHRLVAGGQLNLTGSYAYQSKIDFDPFGDTYQDGYGLLNLRAAWTEPKNHWTVAIYGKNVTDTKYLLQVDQESAATYQEYGHPATYGVELTYRY
jgi:iron complex outermembrane receptor protein